MKRMYGRLLEIPILIMLGLVAIAWLVGVAPAVGLSLAAVVAVAALGLFTYSWIYERGLRVRSRRHLEQAAVEHGMEIRMRQVGRIKISGGMLGFDRSRRKIAFANPAAARVADFDRVRSVSVGVARALGQSAASWYSIDLKVDGQPEDFSVATTSRRQAKKWLRQLGELLGEERVKDARVELG